MVTETKILPVIFPLFHPSFYWSFDEDSSTREITPSDIFGRAITVQNDKQPKHTELDGDRWLRNTEQISSPSSLCQQRQIFPYTQHQQTIVRETNALLASPASDVSYSNFYFLTYRII